MKKSDEYCPGGEEKLPKMTIRKNVRCSVCNRRLLAQIAICEDDESPCFFRVPAHKQKIKKPKKQSKRT